MEKRILTCIGCPMGCQLEVTLEKGAFASVTGNTCKNGARYAQKEVTDPRRIVTTTVRVEGSRENPVVFIQGRYTHNSKKKLEEYLNNSK